MLQVLGDSSCKALVEYCVCSNGVAGMQYQEHNSDTIYLVSTKIQVRHLIILVFFTFHGVPYDQENHLVKLTAPPGQGINKKQVKNVCFLLPDNVPPVGSCALLVGEAWGIQSGTRSSQRARLCHQVQHHHFGCQV